MLTLRSKKVSERGPSLDRHLTVQDREVNNDAPKLWSRRRCPSVESHRFSWSSPYSETSELSDLVRSPLGCHNCTRRRRPTSATSLTYWKALEPYHREAAYYYGQLYQQKSPICRQRLSLSRFPGAFGK